MADSSSKSGVAMGGARWCHEAWRSYNELAAS